MTDLLTTDDRTEWLAWRRQGIGASDVAAIAGLSPWATPMTVWLDKTGQLPDEDSDPMRWGRRLETVVADAFHDDTGLWIVHPQHQITDPEKPWRRSTLDGYVADGPNTAPADSHGPAEIKTTSQAVWDRPPDHVLLQVQWQMLLAEHPQATVIALHADRGFRLTVHHVDADPGLQDVLGQIVDDFWHHHVVAGVEPPADGLTATSEAIRAAWPDSEAGLIVERPDLDQTWRRLLDVRAEAKALAERQAELENTLKAAMTDAEILHVTDGITAATWKTTVSNRLDQKALTAAHPDIAAQFTRPTTSRRFLVKPAREGTP